MPRHQIADGIRDQQARYERHHGTDNDRIQRWPNPYLTIHTEVMPMTSAPENSAKNRTGMTDA